MKFVKNLIWSVSLSLAYPVAKILFNMKIEGKYPRKRGIIIYSNHLSYLDPPLLGIALVRPTYFVAKIELFRNPLFAFVIKIFNAIPLDRKRPSVSFLKKVKKILQSKNNILVFPEGTRNRTGKFFLPFKKGILKFGVNKFCPVYIEGLKFLKLKKIFLYFFEEKGVKIKIGKIFQLKGCDGDKKIKLLEDKLWELKKL